MSNNLNKMREQLEQKKKQRTASSVSDILPGESTVTSEPAKTVVKNEAVAPSGEYKYPWQAFDPADKGKKAGQQSVSVDVNDYELAVLTYLMETRETSTRKEAKRLLRPVLRKVAKHIEENGPDELMFT
ncbi:hypothetical protein KCM76_22865 [Zooshikella marina]|uniref:hypothetical protein n=1 Tax=Zooshikella ganghwensis TaxID=202772 RepID=UPI001BB0B740|nr:hypothetical protein [Zooshikella ganghwensis]MBU2708854.1 hypothetical protein [Zooshikella ganghwensis]